MTSHFFIQPHKPPRTFSLLRGLRLQVSEEYVVLVGQVRRVVSVLPRLVQILRNRRKYSSRTRQMELV
eukprot:COSAG02_NODE_4095_length_5788_cov_3.722271_5_plen_68_part_00